jgi:hypothetical protein
MPAFKLIDLISQAKLVQEFTKGLSLEQCLFWLEQQEVLKTISTTAENHYIILNLRLVSRLLYFFDDKGEFIFIGDNTTFKPQ